MSHNITHVVKRNGKKQNLDLSKIQSRIEKESKDLLLNSNNIAINIINQIYEGISTYHLDILAAKYASTLVTEHPDYEILASRIYVSNIHKSTPSSFSECILNQQIIYNDDFINFVKKHGERLDAMIDHSRDYLFTFGGLDTLVKNSYIHSTNINNESKICDRPQYMYLRLAISIWQKDNDFVNIKQSYDYLSKQYYIHGTPALMNAGMTNQFVSCYILGMDDSVAEIMECNKNCGIISAKGGGIGIHVNNVRSHDSLIKTTNGASEGVPQQLKCFNSTALTWNQGGKNRGRKGSIAVYMDIWHGDILDFLGLKLKQNPTCDGTAKDLFYGINCRDLFMRRLKKNQDWTLFSFTDAPGLREVYDGMPVCEKCNTIASPLDYLKIKSCDCLFTTKIKHNAFTELYEYYEQTIGRKEIVKAKTIFNAITKSWMDNGTPYVIHIDTINRMNNQYNIGPIYSSNLCTEIMEYSNHEEYACCTLASVNLPKFVKKQSINTLNTLNESIDLNDIYDFDQLGAVVQYIVRTLDKIVDVNNYPVEGAYINAQKYRPIGIGVQGLANVFINLGLSWDNPIARRLDYAIFEAIYYYYLVGSSKLAAELGPYSKFIGSPLHAGKFHWELWQENQLSANSLQLYPQLQQWEPLREQIKKYGVRNSLGVALMPTATTSFILNNYECFAPPPNIIYCRRAGKGEITIIDLNLIRELMDLKLWNKDLEHKILKNNSSIYGIVEIPQHIQNKYKTAWDIKSMDLINWSAMRGAYIDQSQSFNHYISLKSAAVLNSIFYYGWVNNLKTGNYYIHTRPAIGKATNNDNLIQLPTSAELNNLSNKDEVCAIDCNSCSS